MAHIAGHLIGRAEELASLTRALDLLGSGVAGAIALAGEPGIGKTRLLHELGAAARSRGYLVMAGTASELERDLAFSVFVDALDRELERVRPGVLAELDAETRTELGHAFPALRHMIGSSDAALQRERHRSHRAARELLEALSGGNPLVLVLDDFHWADSASIELLGALLRRPPAAPVLLALGLRPRQARPTLTALLERAQRDGSLTQIELPALTLAEAGALVGADVDGAAANAMYEESGGNPFYLLQLVRAADMTARAQSVAAELSSTIGVPPAVGAALAEEISLLSGKARAVLEGAAVAGDPFEPELAAVAARVPEDVAVDALDELLHLDLVRPTATPRRFTFRHPLVRRAVYEATPAGWRLRAHERCAQMLVQRGAGAAARAHHVERSARVGDITAVAVLAEAGETTARLAPASAVRWLTAALRLIPEGAPFEARMEILLARARSLAAAGQLGEARSDLVECLKVVPRDQPNARVKVATACAAVEHLLGQHVEARRHLSNALAELDGTDSAEAVGLMIELGADGLFTGDFGAMRDWAGRAIETATRVGDKAFIAAALSLDASACAISGAVEAARQRGDEAAALIDALPDEELGRRQDALANLAAAELFLDRFAATTVHARRGLAIGRATGHDDQFPLLSAMLGGSLWVQGRPLESGDLFDGAIEAARLTDNANALAWALFNRSFAALVAGDLETALATANESVAVGDQMDPGMLVGMAGAVLATVQIEAGHVEQGIDTMLSRAGGADVNRIGGSWRARFLEQLTHGFIAAGRLFDARRAAAATEACARVVGLPSAQAMASLATAAIDINDGQLDRAARLSLAAAAAFESVGALWDAARSRELAGRALAKAGERDRGAAELDLAAAAFESFGSLRYRDRVERELRKLGRRIHRRTRAGAPDGHGIDMLTARELEVARLVVDRKTNAQIATELFLSEKTVETHLRNIFGKMGVDTRVALARAVERAG